MSVSHCPVAIPGASPIWPMPFLRGRGEKSNAKVNSAVTLTFLSACQLGELGLQREGRHWETARSMQPIPTSLLSEKMTLPGVAKLKSAWALQVSSLGDHVLLHAMQPLPDNFSVSLKAAPGSTQIRRCCSVPRAYLRGHVGRSRQWRTASSSSGGSPA